MGQMVQQLWQQQSASYIVGSASSSKQSLEGTCIDGCLRSAHGKTRSVVHCRQDSTEKDSEAAHMTRTGKQHVSWQQKCMRSHMLHQIGVCNVISHVPEEGALLGLLP